MPQQMIAQYLVSIPYLACRMTAPASAVSPSSIRETAVAHGAHVPG